MRRDKKKQYVKQESGDGTNPRRVYGVNPRECESRVRVLGLVECRENEEGGHKECDGGDAAEKRDPEQGDRYC